MRRSAVTTIDGEASIFKRGVYVYMYVHDCVYFASSNACVETWTYPPLDGILRITIVRSKMARYVPTSNMVANERHCQSPSYTCVPNYFDF